MNYLPYIVGAYSIFVAILLWDLCAGLWQIRLALRHARTRPTPARKAPAASGTELIR